jgi:hypothetical protein
LFPLIFVRFLLLGNIGPEGTDRSFCGGGCSYIQSVNFKYLGAISF